MDVDGGNLFFVGVEGCDLQCDYACTYCQIIKGEGVGVEIWRERVYKQPVDREVFFWHGPAGEGAD